MSTECTYTSVEQICDNFNQLINCESYTNAHQCIIYIPMLSYNIGEIERNSKRDLEEREA